mgnify:CR=1 FL=1
MHIILNSLRYALWLVFCLFRHAVFVPAAFGGVCLLAWLVFGHPVSDLNDQLQKEATAWRTAPPGHYMLFLLNAQGVPSISRIVRIG